MASNKLLSSLLSNIAQNTTRHISDMQSDKQEKLTEYTDIVGKTIVISPDSNDHNDASTISKLKIGRVHGGDNDSFYLAHLDNYTTTDYGFSQRGDGSTFINAKNGENICFNINNSRKMTLAGNNGYFGIGVNSPKVPLHVYGSKTYNVVSGSTFEVFDGSSQIPYIGTIYNHQIGLLVESGTVTDMLYVGNNIYLSSDRRIKKRY